MDGQSEPAPTDVISEGKEGDAYKRLREVSLQLLDLGLYEGQKGLETLKQSKFTQVTDPYVHYDEQVQKCVQGGTKAFNFANDKVYNPLKENMIIMYDQSTNYLSLMLKIYKEHQQKIIDYIGTHYENVTILIQERWIQLDFHKYSQMSSEDMRKGI